LLGTMVLFTRDPGLEGSCGSGAADGTDAPVEGSATCSHGLAGWWCFPSPGRWKLQRHLPVRIRRLWGNRKWTGAAPAKVQRRQMEWPAGGIG